MNDLIERLRLGDGTSADHELLLEAADALEALAQPKQEPIGYVNEGAPDRLIAQKQAHATVRNFRLFTHDVPLYTTPHTKVGCAECGAGGGHALYCVTCAENYLKDKNT